MNYQAYPWALFLWAYAQTGYRPFLDRTELGIRLTVDAYPGKWRCTNSMTMELARLLLPLAWLVRVSDTPEHRKWLRTVAEELLQHQQPSGAIQEWLAGSENGVQMPPSSNERYGTGEGTLIQTNGDPAADLLYTNNFALIGLHEAAAATGDQFLHKAERRLAQFVVRCQARADQSLQQFDGAWFRAFDFARWDYWSSSSDNGWGAWCTEVGWSQSWLTSSLVLRTQQKSLWDVNGAFKVAHDDFSNWLKTMLADI